MSAKEMAAPILLTVTLMMPFLQKPCSSASSPRSTTHFATDKYTPEFGQYCDTFYKCKSKSLVCKDYICQCSQPSTMVYDPSKEKCYLKAGERCTKSKDFKKGEHAKSANDIKKSPCAPHSRCNSDRRCTCHWNYQATENGTCTLTQSLWASCKSSSQCQDEKGLQCIDDMCICDRKKYTTYNAWDGKCATMAGQQPAQLNRGIKCVQNAVYSKREKKCMCLPKFHRTSDGLCVAPYGEKCKPWKTLCHRDMLCKNGRCQCRFSGQQYVKGRCVSKLGQPCIIETKEIHVLEEYGTTRTLNFKCTPNTECIAREDNDDVFECQCKPDYLEVKGECQLDHGAWCGSSDEGAKCDESRNFACINSYCSCPVDLLQYFDSQRRECRGFVGAPCTAQDEEDHKEFCTTGAYCKISGKINGHEKAQSGFCECVGGYQLNKDRSCSEVDPARIPSTFTSMRGGSVGTTPLPTNK